MPHCPSRRARRGSRSTSRSAKVRLPARPLLRPPADEARHLHPARDGIHVEGSSYDTDAAKVDLEVITERSDAAAYFRARYGPRIRVRVIARTLTSPGCAGLWDAAAGHAPNEVTIGWEGGGGATFDHAEVAESDDRVVIGVVAQVPNGFRTADLRREEATVTLSRPLGDRKVIDATTGAPPRAP